MKIRVPTNRHMTAVEIKLAHAILAHSTEIGAMAKSPRKAMELVAIDKTKDTWTAEFRVEETAGEKGRYLNANGEVELRNKARTVNVEIYGEGVVAMPSQETAATETVETATPAVETAMTATTATETVLKMPFNPLQNYTMFHNQIRQFLGTDCTVEKVDVAWHEAKRYRVTTAGGVYKVTLEKGKEGKFYLFNLVTTAAMAAQAANNTAPPVQTTDENNAVTMAVYKIGKNKLHLKRLPHLDVYFAEIETRDGEIESLGRVTPRGVKELLNERYPGCKIGHIKGRKLINGHDIYGIADYMKKLGKNVNKALREEGEGKLQCECCGEFGDWPEGEDGEEHFTYNCAFCGGESWITYGPDFDVEIDDDDDNEDDLD